MVVSVQTIKTPTENNTREGFFEDHQHQAVLAQLPEHLKPFAEVGFITGWRGYKDLLTRQWQHVDLGAGWLRIEPGQSKNDEGRQFPLIPRLRAALEEQAERKLAIERATRRIVQPLFFYYDGARAGQPIKSFAYQWSRATERAGCPERIFHDYRRTAVRNLERSGISRSVAMKLVGHKTESVYRRYAIVDEVSIMEAAEKYSAVIGT